MSTAKCPLNLGNIKGAFAIIISVSGEVVS